MSKTARDRLIQRIKDEAPNEAVIREIVTWGKKNKMEGLELLCPPHVQGYISDAWTSHPDFVSWVEASEPKKPSGRIWSFKEEDSMELALNSVDLLTGKIIMTGSPEKGFEVFEITDAAAMECARIKADDFELRSIQRAVSPTLLAEGCAVNTKKMRQIWDYAQTHMETAAVEAPSICDLPLDIAANRSWTLSRIRIRPDHAMPCPTWDGVISRMDDGVAFLAYVAGIYTDANPGNRQVLWLEGPGEDGKSTALQVIGELFGTATSGMKWATIKDSPQFIVSQAAEKRFCYIPDCKNPKLILSESFQQMADGIGLTVVNFKYGKMVQMRVAPRWMVGSNYKPYLIREIFNLSRTLWITISKFEGDADPNTEAKLRAELPGFLSKCLSAYQERCPDNYEIIVNKAVKDKVAAQVDAGEEDHELTFAALFVLDPDGVVTRSELRDQLREQRMRSEEARDFREWLAKVHGIKPTGEHKTFRGMRLRNRADKAAAAPAPKADITGVFGPLE